MRPTADLTLRFESGASASVHLDFIQRPAVHRLELTGLEGHIEWDNADGTVRWRRAGLDAWKVIAPPPGFERNTLFLDEMRHFLECATTGCEPSATLEDGIKVVEIIQAAKRSALELRTITVDDDQVS